MEGGSSSRASPARTSMLKQGGKCRIIISIVRRRGRPPSRRPPHDTRTGRSREKQNAPAAEPPERLKITFPNLADLGAQKPAVIFYSHQKQPRNRRHRGRFARQ